jgi:hypothetical protein
MKKIVEFDPYTPSALKKAFKKHYALFVAGSTQELVKQLESALQKVKLSIKSKRS